MRRVSSQAAVLAVVVASLVLAGCNQVNMLRARQIVQDANKLYQSGNYTAAAAKYEEALSKDPSLGDIYFFVGNSYDNMYKPSKKGEADNDAFLTKAIENYKKSAEMNSAPNIKKLALEYLVAAYGPDKLNDPAQIGRAHV